MRIVFNVELVELFLSLRTEGEKLPPGILRDRFDLLIAVALFVMLVLGILLSFRGVAPPGDAGRAGRRIVVFLLGFAITVALFTAEAYGLPGQVAFWVGLVAIAGAGFLAWLYVKSKGDRVMLPNGREAPLVIAATPVEAAQKMQAGYYEGWPIDKVLALPKSEQVFTNGGEPPLTSLTAFHAKARDEDPNLDDEGAADMIWGVDARKQSFRLLDSLYMAVLLLGFAGFLLAGLSLSRAPIDLVEGENPIELEDTVFEKSKAEIRPAEEGRLLEAAEDIEASGVELVWVVGHASEEGDRAFNLRLSQKRAEAVVGWYREKGLLEDVVFRAYAAGIAYPKLPRQEGPRGEEDLARDRRVELYLVAD